ncbi:MAG: CRISPR-associated protein Cas4 [Methanospirillum sp.]|nr:CRISPR-associated protein Cas4 [Methanospirillum sp.]
MRQYRYSDDDLLALSGIQHFYFCRRQWALIHVERQWEENQRTVEGRFIHERVDDPFISETRGEVIVSRSYPLVSYSLGLFGFADVVEYVRESEGISLPGRDGYWSVCPVEYKRGRPKIDKRDEVQLCAQVMCLEEMLHTKINVADFFYHEIRRRSQLIITDELREIVVFLSDEMHRLFNEGYTPPASSGQNCKACSLVEICMPKLTLKNSSVGAYLRKHVKDASVLSILSDKNRGEV